MLGSLGHQGLNRFRYKLDRQHVAIEANVYRVKPLAHALIHPEPRP